jgi:hypothetical protein
MTLPSPPRKHLVFHCGSDVKHLMDNVERVKNQIKTVSNTVVDISRVNISN